MTQSPTPTLDECKALPPALGELKLTLIRFGAFALHSAMGPMFNRDVREAMARQGMAAIFASISLSPDLVRDAVMQMRTLQCPTEHEEVETALALAAEYDDSYLFPPQMKIVNFANC
ncbi:hypothetical protein ASF24_22760 [Methylobacterium sp. Leaf86]|uniref:hypothetical protein n=1 Tax=Methylobacterium sp. Leaf86 TaxID=1736242 RepID=UPI0006F9164B|nr:hypothetical protein [Methylobacterium sp. Leaf86]KQO51623.1 hypothetical protein ASF24_22760 [Methylobacterium sp. Leaf86]